MVDIKFAVKAAVEFVGEMFPKDYERVTLEEVERDDDTHDWEVTLGLGTGFDTVSVAMGKPREIKYRVFTVDGSTGAVTSMRWREND